MDVPETVGNSLVRKVGSNVLHEALIYWTLYSCKNVNGSSSRYQKSLSELHDIFMALFNTVTHMNPDQRLL
jgi:hypothetical protein